MTCEPLWTVLWKYATSAFRTPYFVSNLEPIVAFLRSHREAHHIRRWSQLLLNTWKSLMNRCSQNDIFRKHFWFEIVKLSTFQRRRYTAQKSKFHTSFKSPVTNSVQFSFQLHYWTSKSSRLRGCLLHFQGLQVRFPLLLIWRSLGLNLSMWLLKDLICLFPVWAFAFSWVRQMARTWTLK